MIGVFGRRRFSRVWLPEKRSSTPPMQADETGESARARRRAIRSREAESRMSAIEWRQASVAGVKLQRFIDHVGDLRSASSSSIQRALSSASSDPSQPLRRNS